ncbi:MAG: enhanced intracellular survival protein Eis [Candidatus Hydrogenedentota bacterium]
MAYTTQEIAALRLRPAENGEEMQRACDLMAKVHTVDYYSSLNWLQCAGASYPGFRPEHVRLAWWHDELAGALRVNLETIRLGEARLRMGGFGWVTTVPQHRNKGVARTLMIDTLRYMGELGCHVSMLFGIPNFYHRFGFASTLSDYAIVVRVPEVIAEAPAGYRTRPGKPGDIRAVQRIHNNNDTEVPCSIVRTAAHITNQWERWKELRVITDQEGAVVAYFVARAKDNELLLEEAGVAHQAACTALLRACATLASESYLPCIRFSAPPPHPLSRYLLTYRSLHEMRVDSNGSGMMAFVSIEETLESMLPEWEGNLARHAARDYRTEVTLLIDGVPYRIRANRGVLDVAKVTGKNKFSLDAGELMHLLTGYRYLNDVYNTDRRIITAEARELLEVLFPKRWPYVWPIDRF